MADDVIASEETLLLDTREVQREVPIEQSVALGGLIQPRMRHTITVVVCGCATSANGRGGGRAPFGSFPSAAIKYM